MKRSMIPFLSLIALLTISTSYAQSTRIKKPKLNTKLTKNKVSKMKAIKKKSVKLSQFGCHRQLKNSTQQNYVGWCASGPKVAKKVICTGTRPITVGGKEVYRSVLCTVQHSAQPNRYKIATEVGQGNKYVEPYKVVDMACGCGPHVAQQTCSGGLCSVSIPAS